MSTLKLKDKNNNIQELELTDEQVTNPSLKINNKYAGLVEYDNSEYPIKVNYNGTEYGLGEPVKDVGYLTFTSTGEYSMRCDGDWEGTLEYSEDTINWYTLPKGCGIQPFPGDIIYLRGTGNSIISCGHTWSVRGSGVRCTGNIETLLDYKTVLKGKHPVMGEHCFENMFQGSYGLIEAPTLPATKLSNNCYAYMFYGCTNLVQAPTLPATELAKQCYKSMFEGCTSLIEVPKLPATILVDWCYYGMFMGCSSLKFSTTKTAECPNEYRIPTVGAGTAVDWAMQLMFYGNSGTFKYDPEINTTYYTNAKII